MGDIQAVRLRAATLVQFSLLLLVVLVLLLALVKRRVEGMAR